MKFVVGLSSCALVALSVAPSLAANRAISSSTVRSLSLPSTTTTIYVAGLLETVVDGVNTIDRIQQRATSEQRQREAIERQQKQAEEARLQREAKMEAARQQQEEQRAAQAAKAEEQRKQWARLTPKQKKEYLARQRASQEAQAAFWLQILTGGMGGGRSEPSTSGQDQDRAIWKANQEVDQRVREQKERDRQLNNSIYRGW